MIDLRSAKVIDAVFLKDEHLNDYTLSASNDDSTYTEIEADIVVPAHGHSFITFTNTTAYRYWRLSFSQHGATGPNYRIYESS